MFKVNNNQYQQLFQALPFGLVNLNHAGHIVSINRCGSDMLGEKVEYLHNLEFLLFLHADSFESYQDNRLLAVDRGEVQSSEIVLRGKNGATIYTHCYFIPVEPNDDTGQLILCLQNITQTKALESQLGAIRAPDRKLLHDLNNVFTAISGYTELTQMKMDERAIISGEDLALLHRYMKEIRAGLGRGEDLISQNRKQRQASPQSNLHQREAQILAGQGPKRILIIDDEEPIVKFLEELMQQQGYQVDCFTRSTAALKYFRDHAADIDLVILDQNMPEMNGVELATEMKSLKLDQPIILCTGTTSLIRDQLNGRIHIRYFASKPIDINELLAMVSEILQDRSLQRRLSEF